MKTNCSNCGGLIYTSWRYCPWCGMPLAFIVGVDAAWYRNERRRRTCGLDPSHEALLAAGRQLHEARARGNAVDMWRAIGRIESLCAQNEDEG